MSANTDNSQPAAPQKRILTGDRPTGRLHLGHYVGSLKARVELQHRYDTILIIADLHMLTTKPLRQDIEQIADLTFGAVTVLIDGLGYDIQSDPVEKIIGSGSFSISVAP
ncbi:MAG: hypothetical protein N3A66_08645, partial [Planctomycetota bacterium]|nr:hypothetical protein [Planctomycetota bacterium]